MKQSLAVLRQLSMSSHVSTQSFFRHRLWFLLSALLICQGMTSVAHGQVLRYTYMLTALPTEGAVRPFRMTDVAVPNMDSQSILGLGDQIQITVFGQPDMSAEVTVGEAGTIMLPLVGTIKVTDLTSAQTEALIASRLRTGGYLKNPSVSVQIRQIRSQMISVLGEVQRPGRFPLPGRMTVLEALATAGGLTQRAGHKVVVVRRAANGKYSDNQRVEVDIQLDQAAAPGRGLLDVPLINDDVLFVGPQKQFYVHGEVRRPGVYPMEPSLNVMKALSISGGVSDRGSIRRIRLHRLDENKVLRETSANPATELQADDVLFIDERLF